eukprot:5982324-Pyramimonas_sp.AAC.1
METTTAELATTVRFVPGTPLRSIRIYLDGSGGGSPNQARASTDAPPVPAWGFCVLGEGLDGSIMYLGSVCGLV